MFNYFLPLILLLIILLLTSLLFKTKKQLKKANEDLLQAEQKARTSEIEAFHAQLEVIEKEEKLKNYMIYMQSVAGANASKTETKPKFTKSSLASLQEYPYRAERLLTKTEYSFYKILKTECDNKNLLICPKVRMDDFLEVTYTDSKKRFKYRNHVKPRHIDFLICDKNLYLLAGIELDGESHNDPDAKIVDNFKDNVFKTINYPLYRIPVSNQNNYKIEIQKIFLELLYKKPKR